MAVNEPAAVTANEPTPAASEPAQCQLVQDAPGQPGEVDLHVEVIAEGLKIPWGLAILANRDLLLTERPGRVRLIQGGEIVPVPVLEFGVSMPPPLYGIDLLGSDAGLLGLLLPPNSLPTACSTSSTTQTTTTAYRSAASSAMPVPATDARRPLTV